MKLTKREQKLIREFDQDSTNLVISHWPNVGKSFDGVATYTQDLVTKFAKKFNHKFVVMVPYEWSGSRVKQVSKNILVVGVFDEHKLHLYPKILTWLKEFPRVEHVVVHSEFCASGGIYVRAMVVPFLALIKATGREVTYYAHNIASDIGEYQEHLGLPSGVRLDLTRLGYRVYLKALSYVVDTFVVLEDSIKQRLIRVMGGKVRVLVTPHWIETKKAKVSKLQARKILGIEKGKKVVVSFGFLSWYKGSDVMAQAAKSLPESYLLVLAGGEATSLQDKVHYVQYLKILERNVNESGNVAITGFLSDIEMDLWFAATDLAILPYRLSMGGSGALQQSLRRGVPILISEAIREGLSLDWPDSFDGNDPQNLTKAIKRYFGNVNLRKGVAIAVRDLAKQRKLEKLLFSHFDQVYSRPKIDQAMLE